MIYDCMFSFPSPGGVAKCRGECLMQLLVCPVTLETVDNAPVRPHSYTRPIDRITDSGRVKFRLTHFVCADVQTRNIS